VADTSSAFSYQYAAQDEASFSVVDRASVALRKSVSKANRPAYSNRQKQPPVSQGGSTSRLNTK
jgi:hypothetical protein